MPRGGGFAAEARKIVAEFRARGEAIDLEKSPWSNTGFTNVVKVKDLFQARLQVPGDGRGGSEKRKQYPLPGLFFTAEDAAIYLAMMKRGTKAANAQWRQAGPPADVRQAACKPRSKQPLQPAATQPAAEREPLQSPMPTAMGMPLAMPMFHVPFATVSPLPMPPLGSMPPRF